MLNQLKITILILSSGLLSACSPSLVMETSVNLPQPITSALPLNIAVLHNQELSEHVYTEDSEDRQNWSITTGPSQVELFNQVFSSLFRSIETVEDVSPFTSQQYDAVITPVIVDMQFSTPQETKNDLYEVWVKYNLLIQQPDGAQIVNLPITGYGKWPANFLHYDSEGLSNAANFAFRDVGAKVLTSFRSNPKIQEWLTSKSISN